MELTIAGRYMVYAPTGEGVGVSRRLEDKERDRLRKEAKQLDLGGGGAIIRTAAHGAQRADFERELQYLFKLNEVLEKRVEEADAPALVFQEADLSVRVVRDIFSEHFERAVVDDEKQHHRLVSFFARTAPELVDRVELWEDADEPLFEAYGVEPVIEGMLSRRVDLPSGGYLMIDYAEALTVIDVNTGSFTGRGKAARLEDTITKTNLEAAEEVVNQLRLRDIGGIIVIDFIDMARARNRDAVLKTLRKALDEDRTKTFVVEISPLGLVEMTRQNVTDGVREIMTQTCPVCGGEGVIKSEETMAIHVARHLREMVRRGRRRRRRRPTWCGSTRGSRPGSPADGARELQALEERDGPLLPLRGLRGAAARPLRDRHGGLARGGRRAGGAVPRGRGGPRRHRRAAHVQRRRRGRQGRRLHHLRDQRRRRSSARRSSCASRTRAARPRPRRSWAPTPRRPREAAAERAKEREKADQRARAARRPRGRAKRKARERARRRPRPKDGRGRPSRRSRPTSADAGTAPAAAADADEDGAEAAPPARRARPLAASRGRDRTAEEPTAEAAGGARGRLVRGRRGRIEASAPRPQRRTAPFARQGRSRGDGSLRSQRVT